MWGRSEEWPARVAEGGVEVVGRVAVVEGVLELVEAMLEDSEAKEESDQEHHQYQASAEHAYPAPAATTHPLPLSLSFPLSVLPLHCSFYLNTPPPLSLSVDSVKIEIDEYEKNPEEKEQSYK